MGKDSVCQKRKRKRKKTNNKDILVRIGRWCWYEEILVGPDVCLKKIGFYVKRRVRKKPNSFPFVLSPFVSIFFLILLLSNNRVFFFHHSREARNCQPFPSSLTTTSKFILFILRKIFNSATIWEQTFGLKRFCPYSLSPVTLIFLFSCLD